MRAAKHTVLTAHTLLLLYSKPIFEKKADSFAVYGTTNQKYYPDVASDTSSAWNLFLRSFLRSHFAGKPVVMSRMSAVYFRVTSLLISFRILMNLLTETERRERSRGFRGSLARDRRRLACLLSGCAFFIPRASRK